MRSFVLLRRPAFAVALTFSAFLLPRAQAQFQEPTKQELQMTDDPQAPGAAAVYLYREETTDDTLHFHSYYERIKVLTEKGKELATIRVPYEHGSFRVKDIQGRTIHPDGTIVPLTAKPSDLVDIKTKEAQVNTMVFTLPSVEVGSILEYRLDLRYDDDVVSAPVWDVQQPYFVHKAHYFFKPSGSSYLTNQHGDALTRLLYITRGDTAAKVVRDASGRYSFDVTDVPAIPEEDWMPPLNSIKWRVAFYYSAVMNRNDFWQLEGKRWSKEANRFANPGDAVRQAAAALVSAGDTEEQKASKLYEAVMKLDNTDFTRAKSEAERKAEKLKEAKDSDGVWNQRSGDSNQLALLYVAMARAAGLQAWPMEVVDRNRAIFDADYLSDYQLDDYVAIVMIGGKEVFLDPGEKMCPFGLLHWKHTMTGGLRGGPNGTSLAYTPGNTYLQNTLQRVAFMTISPEGNASGSVRFIMTGQDALRWRQTAIEEDKEEVQKRFREWAQENLPDGTDAEFQSFVGLDDYNTNLIATVKVKGAIGTATGKRFFVPGLFFESRSSHPFVAQAKRTIPVDVKFPARFVDTAVYELPSGYSLESAPQETDIPWPKAALFKIVSKADGSKLTVERVLAYNFTLVPPNEYGPLHDFYQKVATADQQQVVLSRSAPAAKGN